MSAAPGLDSLSLSEFLEPSERALFRRGDLQNVESLRGYIDASPSLDATHGVRRAMLLSLLQQQMPASYPGTPPPPVTYGVDYGADPTLITTWPARTPSDAVVSGPMTDVNLLQGFDAARWVVRDQVGAPTCVAQAVVACIELLRARKTGTVEPWSVRFVDEQLRARRRALPSGAAAEPGMVVPPGAATAKLCEAAIVLEVIGICREANFDETAVAPGVPPSPAAWTEADQNKYRAALYRDFPPSGGQPGVPSAGFARMIYSELRLNRPVAIALPGYRDRSLVTGPTSWDRPDVWRTGIVTDPDPKNDVTVVSSGHAVCLVGFQISDKDPLGGYFTFRNSWGENFGRLADDPESQTVIPHPPMPGYGAISASHVDRHCWEAVSFGI